MPVAKKVVKKAVKKVATKKAATRGTGEGQKSTCWQCGSKVPASAIKRCPRCGKWKICEGVGGSKDPGCTLSGHLKWCEKNEKPSRSWKKLHPDPKAAAPAKKSAPAAKKEVAPAAKALSKKSNVEASPKRGRSAGELLRGRDAKLPRFDEEAEAVDLASEGLVIPDAAEEFREATSTPEIKRGSASSLVVMKKPKGVVLKHDVPTPIKSKPVAILTGQDETIEAAVKVVVKSLRVAGDRDAESDFTQQAHGASSYEDIIRIAEHFVDVR